MLLNHQTVLFTSYSIFYIQNHFYFVACVLPLGFFKKSGKHFADFFCNDHVVEGLSLVTYIFCTLNWKHVSKTWLNTCTYVLLNYICHFDLACYRVPQFSFWRHFELYDCFSFIHTYWYMIERLDYRGFWIDWWPDLLESLIQHMTTLYSRPLYTVMSSQPVLGSDFHWQMFPFLRVPELSPASTTTSFSQKLPCCIVRLFRDRCLAKGLHATICLYHKNRVLLSAFHLSVKFNEHSYTHLYIQKFGEVCTFFLTTRPTFISIMKEWSPWMKRTRICNHIKHQSISIFLNCNNTKQHCILERSTTYQLRLNT
jgi:hypothetical protein